ncbi:hypothetical protein Tco_1416674 [Tanacetum coccineum]
MEVFIGGLPRCIEGNVTVSKPQTLEEAITITQRLMDQVTKHNYVQETNDHKRKFDDRITFTTITTRITVITTATMITTNSRIEDKKPSKLMLSPQLKTVGGSSDQELQKQRASQWKQPAASVSNLSCMWRERTLQKPVPKSKQQCLWKSILAEG